MNTIAVRLTKGGLVQLDEILKYFSEYEVLITEEHIQTNHHFNLLFDTSIQVNTFRNKMNRHFKCIKNQSYCRLDKGNYAVYILKEDKVLKNTYCTAAELELLKKQSYIKYDKPPSFRLSIILNYEYKDPFCFPIDDYIAKYVIKSLNGTIHSDFDIQNIGNAIASKYYPDIYINKSKTFNFLSIYNN